MKAGRPSKDSKYTLELSDVSNTPKKTVRVNFNISEDKHIALKKYVIDNRTTVSKLLQDMIDERLSQR